MVTIGVQPSTAHRPNSPDTSHSKLHNSRIIESLDNLDSILSNLESKFDTHSTLESVQGATTVTSDTDRDQLFYHIRPNSETSPNSDDELDLTNMASDLQTTTDKLNSTFEQFFSRQRSDEFNSTIKDEVRESLIKQFRQFGLKVLTQTFVVRTFQNGRSHKLRGVNLIGVLEGRTRRQKSNQPHHRRNSPFGEDKVTVIGAHYDTVEYCPGVDDNGSGSVAVLELARLTALRSPIDQTIIFVLFDLEEYVSTVSPR